MPSRERVPLPLALVVRELRALALSRSSWGALAFTAAASGLALARVDADALVEDAERAALAGLSLAGASVLPLVAAWAFARDKESRADVLLAQLGQTTAVTTTARACALLVGFAVLCLPVLSAFIALRLMGVATDANAIASALLGHGLAALVVIGSSSVAAGLSSSVAAARLLAFVAALGPWLHARTGGPGAAFLPVSAVRVFERGVVDVRDVLALAAGGLGLCALGAVLLERGPGEKRWPAALVVVVVMLVATVGASRVRLSFDVTADQRSSLSPSAAAALAGIGDPIRATVGARPDEPAFAALQRSILVPVARAAELRVRHDPSLDDDVVVWQVGPRSAPVVSESRARTVPEVVPLLLELAGLQAPLVVDLRPPPARLPDGRQPILVGTVLLCGAWPALALVLLVITSRARRGQERASHRS